MIYNLRIKFIKIAAASVIGVLLLIYLGIFAMNTIQLNSEMDRLADMLTINEGRFPDNRDGKEPNGLEGKPMDGKHIDPNDIRNKEEKFSTRFFTVVLDADGETVECNTDFIVSVNQEQAVIYAKDILTSGNERGWYSSFRFKTSMMGDNTRVVFVDGSNNQSIMANSLVSAAVILIASGLLVILLIVFFSKKAVKPVAESYEKQKQFITDANHELKTPLTLILANLDIAEAELGQNEWLDDIRYEGEQMTILVNKLVTLSRMDEEDNRLNKLKFSLSEACLDIISEFQVGAECQGIIFESSIAGDVMLDGDESAIRQLLSILLDNALKYCDKEGSIRFRLTGGHHPVISLSNSFRDVDKTELSRLFDRFYRSDKARTSGSGFGIGLAIAKAIVEKHGGSIEALKPNEGVIEFKIVL